MTRLITDGAEFGDILFWDIAGGGVDSTTKRSGIYSYYASVPDGGGTKLVDPHLTEFYFRYGSYAAGAGADAWELIAFGPSSKIILKLSTDLKLYWQVNGVNVATGVYAFTSDAWHLLDMYVKIGTSGSLLVKLDGILDAQYYGDTTCGGTFTEVDRFSMGASYHLGYYPRQYIDDIALNDTSGSADNTWCGDGHVELLRPNAEGDTLEWVPSSGSIHYAVVDDFPPNGDTDYIGTIMPNKKDMFNLAAFDDTNKMVRRVYSEARARDMSAVGQQLRLGIKTSGSIFNGPLTTLSYNYGCVKGVEHLVNPVTGAAWTKEQLDALQFVVNSEDIIG